MTEIHTIINATQQASNVKRLNNSPIYTIQHACYSTFNEFVNMIHTIGKSGYLNALVFDDTPLSELDMLIFEGQIKYAGLRNPAIQEYHKTGEHAFFEFTRYAEKNYITSEFISMPISEKCETNILNKYQIPIQLFMDAVRIIDEENRK